MGELRFFRPFSLAVIKQTLVVSRLLIVAHLVARSGRDAGDYTQTIDVLSDLGIIPSDFAQQFRGIGGFRNALVHGCLGVKSTRFLGY